jgi:carboxyl-terminal processing protease
MTSPFIALRARMLLALIPVVAGAAPVEPAPTPRPASAPASAAPEGEAKAGYAKDVEFLLTELEKRAGHFFTLKKIDWPKVSAQFREEVKQVPDDSAFAKLCARLLARLKDGHARLTALKVKFPDESQGRRWTGPRVHLLAQGGKVYVRAAFKDAEAAGVKPGMEVTQIDGKPAQEWLEAKTTELADLTGFSTPHQALYAACHWGLEDWEGKTIRLELKDAKGEEKSLQLTRNGGPNAAPLGPVFPPAGAKAVGRQTYAKTAGGYGYIHLRDVPAELPTQLDKMLAALGDVPGLILDTRANGGGGCDHEAVFARFLAAGEKWRQYTGAGTRPFTGPMIVIVDAGTRSAGETIAGQFGEDGRAYVIGDTPTAGMSSQKQSLAVPSGMLSVIFSVRSNKARFNEGKGIEGIGVPPMEVVPYVPAELASGVDSEIRRAEEIFKAGLPVEKVAYEKARKK